MANRTLRLGWLLVMLAGGCTQSVSSAPLQASSSATPASAVADGNHPIAVSVDVITPVGSPAGLAVTFSTDANALRLVRADAALDGNGHAQASFVSQRPGIFVVVAEINSASAGDGSGLLRVQQSILFVSPEGTGAAGVPAIKLSATPASVVADGNAAALLTVTGRDAANGPLAGQAVQLATSGANGEAFQLERSQGLFDANGTFTTSLRSTRAGVCSVLAASGNATGLIGVEFLAGSLSAAQSALVLSAQAATADGVDAVSGVLRARDLLSNPRVGQAVSFAVDSNAASVTPRRGITDSNGNLAVRVSSSMPGPVTVSARVEGADLSSIASFVALQASQSLSSLAGPVQAPVADGNQPASLSLRLRDAAGRPLANAPVSWSVDGNAAGASFAQADAATDANGFASAALVSQSLGPIGVSVQAGGITLRQAIPFSAGALSSELSSFVANTSSLVADGTSSATLTLTLRDAFRHPIVDAPVSLSTTLSGVRFSIASGQTDAAGSFSAQLSGQRSGMARVVASTTAAALGLDLRLVAGAPSTAASQLFASPATVIADGNDSSVISLLLRDALGNAEADAAVSLDTDATGAVLTPASGTTDGFGLFVSRLRSTEAGPVSVGLSLGQRRLSTSVTVLPSAPDVTASHLAVTPAGPVAADGNAAATACLSLKDAYDNPTPSQRVQWASARPEDSVLPVTSLTDANGLTCTNVRSTLAGLRAVTATSPNVSLVAFVPFQAGPAAGTSVLGLFPAGPVVANGSAQAQLRLQAKDAFGNAVPNANVALTPSAAGDVLTPLAGTTDADGVFAATWTTTQAGSKTVTARVGEGNALALSASKTFVPGPLDVAHSALELSPNAVVAGGAPSLLLVRLRDAFGNVLPAVPVDFSASSPLVSALPASGVSDANGSLQSTLSSTQAGTWPVAATAAGVRLSSQIAVSAAAPSAAASRFDVTPASLTADGNSAAHGTLRLVDGYGNPVPNLATQVSSSFASLRLSGAAATDANGQLDVEATATRAGHAILLASAGNVTLSAPLLLVAGPPAAATSTLALAANAVVADGASASIATLVLRDATGNAVANRAVAFSASPNAVQVALPAGAVTDGEGKVQAWLTSAVSGPAVVTADVGTASLSAPFAFVAGPPSVARSVLLVTPPAGATADGQSSVSVALTARDAFGNPVAGSSAHLSASLASATLLAPDLVLDGNGQAATSVTSTVAGPLAVTAVVDGVTFSAQVPFVAGPADANASYFGASPSSVLDDGNATASLFLLAADAFGNPVTQAPVSLAISGNNASLSPTSGRTAVDGTFFASCSATVAEAKTVSATLGSTVLTTDVNFVTGLPNDQTIGFSAIPPSVVADGVQASNVTLSLRDPSNQPISSAQVSLSVAGAAATIANANGTTDANGLWQTQVTGTSLGTARLTAEVSGVRSVALVTFVAGAPNVSLSSLTAATPQAVADGNAGIVLMARLVDDQGHPVAAQGVAWSSSGAQDAFADASSTTDAAGAAVNVLRSTRAGTPTVQASFAGGARSLPVQFVSGRPAAGASSLTVTPNVLVADGNQAADVAVLLADAQGNPASAANVTLSSATAGPMFDHAGGPNSSVVTTDANGACHVRLLATRAGSGSVVASAGGVVLSAPLSVVAGPAARARSSLVAPAGSTVADGASQAAFVLQLADAYGNPLANDAVTATVMAGAGTLTPAAGVTGPDGRLAVGLASPAAGTSQVVLQEASSSLSFSGSASFVAGAVSQGTSSWTTATPTLTAGDANGARFVLTARDALGNAVANVPVVVVVGGRGGLALPVSGQTDANGVFASVIQATTAEQKDVAASFAGGQKTSPLTVVPAAPSASTSALAASPAAAVADGATPMQLVASVRDRFANTVSGQNVTFASSQAGDSFASNNAASDAAGVASVSLTSRTAGARTFSASFAGGTVTLPYVFAAGPVSSTRSKLTVSPNVVVADGAAAGSVTVTMVDALQNPVAGQTVTLTAFGSGNALGRSSGTSDANGLFVTTVTSTVAEAKTLTASTLGVSWAGGATFVSGPPAYATTTLSANPLTVTANGNSVSTLVAAVRDAFGNPCANATVQFAATGSNNVFSQATGSTDAAGTVATSLASSTAEGKAVQLNVGTIARSLNLTFVPGAPDATASSLLASPNSQRADAQSAINITVAARDARGNPVAGQAVSLASPSAALRLSATSGITAADGSFAATATSSAAGTVPLTATLGGTSLSTTLSFSPGPADANASVVTASPSQLVANGNATSALTVVAADKFGNLVAGQAVSLSVSGGNNLLANASGVADAAGSFVTSLRSTKAENKVVSATLGAVTVSTPVTFVTGGASGDTSTFVGQGNGPIVADNVAAATFKLTAKDSQGNPLPNQAVALTASGSNNALQATPSTTDSNGTLTVTLRSTRAELKQVQATVGGVTLTSPATFVAGAISAAHSSLLVSPNTLLADGTSQGAIGLSLADAFDNPVTNAAVSLAATGNCALSANQLVTDATGVAAASLRSARTGSKTVTASWPGGALTALVNLIPGAVANGSSSLLVSPNMVVADGVSQATLSVALADAYGNPIPYERVSFAATGAAGATSFAAPSATTDLSGKANVTVSSTATGARLVTAQAQGTSLSAGLTFLSGPPSSLTSTLSAYPSTVTADGTSGTTLLLTVRDAFGNAIGNQAVALTAGGGNNLFGQPSGTTSDAGTYLSALRSTTAGLRTITASAGGTAISTPVSFLPGPPSVATSSWTASPTQAVADGTSPISLSLSLRDAQNNAVPNAAVVVSLSGPATTSTPNSGVTDANGWFVVQAVSTRAQSETATAASGALSLTVPCQFVAGQASGQNTVLTASPNALIADGNAVSVVAVRVADALNNPVVNANVHFAATGAQVTWSATDVATDANGAASVTARATSAGQALLTATIGGIGVSTPLVLQPGPVQAAHSTLTFAPAAATADGNSAIVASAILRDAHDNPVAGQPVVFAASGNAVASSAPSAVTDATGTAQTALRSSVAEAKQISATAGSQVLLGNVTFVAGAISNATSLLTATPNQLVANGNDAVTVTLLARDAFGNRAGARTAAFACTGSSNVFGAPSITTDANGAASTTVRSTVAENKTVLVTVDGTSFSLPVRFVPGPASSANSVLSALPAQGLADGASPVILTLSAADAFGNPLSSQAVSWSSTGGLNALSSSGSLTDGSGFAGIQLRSRRAESKTVSAQIGGLTRSLSVPFVAGAADANVSTLTVSPSYAVADGNAAIRVTVLAADAFGNPAGNQPLSIDLGGSNATLDANAGITDGSGQFVTTLRSTRAEAKPLSVSLGAARLTASALFVAGSPNAARSTLAISPNAGVVADGNATAGARVNLADAFGNPVAGQVVTFAASGAGTTWQGASGTTNPAGAYGATLVSTRAEAKTITLTAGSTSLTGVVAFVAGPPASASTVLVASTPNAPVADGQAAVPLTGQVADALGNPVGGAAWSLAASGSRNALSPNGGVTDANGRLAATLVSSRAETKTVSLLVGGAMASTPVTFVAGTPNAALSTMAIAPSSNVAANNVSAATVAATVVDAFGNPVPGQPFTLTASGSNNVLGLSGGNTDASGSLSTTLRTRTAETKTVTLSAAGAAVSANVAFVAGSPNAVLSRWAASPNAGVVADGNAQASLSLALFDAFGNAVQGQNVTITSSSSADAIVPRQGQTAADGTFAAGVASVFAGSRTLTAAAGDLQFSTPMAFVAGPPSASTTTLVASPATLAAGDANGPAATLVASVSDVQGNPVQGQGVSLAGNNGNDQFAAASGTTDANGRFVTAFRSRRAESKLITLTAGPASVTAALTVVAGSPNASLSSFVASPAAGVVADGNGLTRLTLTVADDYANPVQNRTFAFASSSGNDLFGAVSGATNLSGVLTTAFSGTRSGARVLSATGGNVILTANVTLLSGPVDAGQSRVSASPNANVIANAAATSTVTVTARDAQGNPVAGQNVTVLSASPNVSFSAAAGLTDANGLWSTSVVSTRAGTKTVQASAGAFSGNATVAFVAGPADSGTSTFSAVPASGTVADGNAAVALRVALADAYGNAVAGQGVSLSSSNANDLLAQASGSTDANGLFVTGLRSTRAESKTVTVSAGPISGSVQATFVAGSPNLGHSSFVAAPTANVVADNNAQVLLSAYLADVYDNPAANVAISLAATGSNNTFSPASGTTGANGNFVAAWTSSRAENKTVTWSAAGLSPNASATFVAGALSGNVSTLALVPNGNVYADGNYVTTVNFTANDAFANRIGNVNVTFSCSPSCSLSPNSGTTSAAGALATQLAGTQPGAATVVASAGGANVSLPVTFVSPLPGASITLSPNSVTAGGNTQVSITLRLADSSNQTLANTAYRLMSSVPGVTFSKATGASDGNGAATATLTSLYTGQQSIRAYFGSQVVNANLTVAGKTPTCASGAPTIAGQTWTYNTSWQPFRMALADLNGDGKSDLAFTSQTGTPFFVVMLNDGNDRFLSPKQFSGSGYQYGIAVADVTGDGNPDVITTSNDRGFVTVYQGAGNGNFSQLKTVSVGSGPYEVLAADFDADGAPDLAVSNASSANVSLLWGLGNGNFSLSTLNTDAAPRGLAQGFVDSDGQRDLVVACNNTGYGVNVFLGQGNRTFASRASYLQGTAATYVAVGDLNGDGYGDVAVSAQQANGLLIYFADSTGALSLNANLLTANSQATAIALYDVNGDGNVDVVQGQGGSGRTQVRLNAGNGQLQSPNAVTGGSVVQDVRVLKGANGNVPMLISIHGGGSVGFVGDLDRFGIRKRSVAAVGQFPRDFVVDDFNKDGALDVFVANFYNQSPVYLGNSGGNLLFPSAASSTLSTSGSGLLARAGDVNLDGNVDLVVATQVPALDAFLNQGNGSFAARKTSSTSAVFNAMQLVDWNNDGTLDVLGVSGDTNGVLSVYSGAGNGNFQSAGSFVSGKNPFAVSVADLNVDGAMDAVVANAGENNVAVFFGKGDGTVVSRTLYNAGAGGSGLAVLDLNGDGYTDVVIANGAQKVVTLVNQGDGTLVQKQSMTAFAIARSVSMVDWNNDGRPDVVGVGVGDFAVQVFLSNGDGTVSSPTVFSGPVGDLVRVKGTYVTSAQKPAIVVAGDTEQTVDILQSNACP